MSCKTCSYRFECIYADAYYLPSRDSEKEKPILARWIDRGLIWLAGILLAANILNQLGKWQGWW